MERIHHHLSELSAENAETSDKLFQYQKNLALKKIYLGQSTSLTASTSLVDLVAVKENNYRCICIGCLKEKDSRHLDPDYIMKQIGLFSLTAICHTVIDDIFTCLILQSDNQVYSDSQIFFGSLNDLLSTLNGKNNSRFAIGISDVYNSTESISLAYQEARKSWQSAFF